MVRAVVATAAAVTGPVHGLLCCHHRYPWAPSHPTALHPANWVPRQLLERAGRLEALLKLDQQLKQATGAAGWYGGVVAADSTSHPGTVLHFALTGAALTDIDAARADLLSRMWADAIPPSGLADPAEVELWCRLRAAGASRSEAATTVRGVFAAPSTVVND